MDSCTACSLRSWGWVDPGGSTHTTIAGDLFAPYGIAIKDGSAYVTVGAVAKDVGQVLRIRL